MSRNSEVASSWATGTVIVLATLLLGNASANALPMTITFDDTTNYSGGVSVDTPDTYTENGVMFTVPDGAGNHLDPFTGGGCGAMGVLCWHDGASNTIIDNVLTLSLVSGGTFELVELDFLNQRNDTDLVVSSSAGHSVTISEGLAVSFHWTNITFVRFDIPFMTTAETLPSLDNVVVIVPEPSSLALFALGLAGLRFAGRYQSNSQIPRN